MTAPTPEQVAAGQELWQACIDRALTLVEERAGDEQLTLAVDEQVLVELGIAAGVTAAWGVARDRRMLAEGPA